MNINNSSSIETKKVITIGTTEAAMDIEIEAIEITMNIQIEITSIPRTRIIITTEPVKTILQKKEMRIICSVVIWISTITTLMSTIITLTKVLVIL